MFERIIRGLFGLFKMTIITFASLVGVGILVIGLLIGALL